jgi:hypothetical protein
MSPTLLSVTSSNAERSIPMASDTRPRLLGGLSHFSKRNLNMLERLKAFFRNLFSRFQSKPKEGTTIPTITVGASTAVLSLDTEAGWNAYRDSVAPTTRAYLATWDQKVARDKQDAAIAALGGAPDISGFELKAPNYNTANTLVNGQTYTFYVGKSGTVTVAPVSGNQLLKVNGQPVIHAADIHNVPVGPITIAVESVTGQVQVRVW